MSARFLSIGPLVMLLPSCAASMRAAEKTTVTRGDVQVQGEVNLTGGLGGASKEAIFVGVPLTLAIGSRVQNPTTVVHFESGLEGQRSLGESRWGYRVGLRFGGAVVGPGGAYVGLRMGPTFALVKAARAESAQTIPVISLEGIGNTSFSGDSSGYPTFGGVLSFGLDFYSGFNMRIPSGRPVREASGVAIEAPVRRGASWSGSTIPAVGHLSVAERKRLGEAWLAEARTEHASIAAFSTLALSLLAIGAPAQLVEGAHRAALDEARHARLCFGVAGAYLDAELEPGPLPMDRAMAPEASLERLALASLVEGTFGEGMAAALCRARSKRADDPAIRRVLATLARDEAAHAKLGWSVLRYAVARLGAGFARELGETWRALAMRNETGHALPDDLAHHGIATETMAAAARRSVTRKIDRELSIREA